MIKVGIVGGTGYTGQELARLLCRHPHVEIVGISARSDAGQKYSDIYANMRVLYNWPVTSSKTTG